MKAGWERRTEVDKSGNGSGFLKKIGQLGDVRRDPPRLLIVEQFGCCQLIVKIDIGERLSALVADDETSCLFFDGPRRRKVAAVTQADHRILVKRIKYDDRSAH